MPRQPEGDQPPPRQDRQKIARMPRDATIVAGIDCLRGKLPTLETAFFHPDCTDTTETFDFGNGHRVAFSKTGYTRSGIFKNISYKIEFSLKRTSATDGTLTIYVKNPARDVAANRRAVDGALREFIATENHVVTRDVEAAKFAAA